MWYTRGDESIYAQFSCATACCNQVSPVANAPVSFAAARFIRGQQPWIGDRDKTRRFGIWYVLDASTLFQNLFEFKFHKAATPRNILAHVNKTMSNFHIQPGRCDGAVDGLDPRTIPVDGRGRRRRGKSHCNHSKERHAQAGEWGGAPIHMPKAAILLPGQVSVVFEQHAHC